MNYLCSTRPSPKRANRLCAPGLVALLGLSFGLASCSGVDWFLLKRSLRIKFNDVRWITPEELAAWMEDKNRPQPVLLDVRTPAEWKVSHLPGARRIDPAADAEAAGNGLPKETPIVAYCAVGYRSGKIAERLRNAGYENVQNLDGSIFQWANEHRPLVSQGQPVSRVHPYNAVWGRLLKPEVRASLPDP